MINEFIFIIHFLLRSLFVLITLFLGKEVLVPFIFFYRILANLFITKQIVFFSFDATTFNAFAIVAILDLNIIQKFFSTITSKYARWINFLYLGIYIIIFQLYFRYTYTLHILDYTHSHFCALLIRIMLCMTFISINLFLFV